ncbi:MAG TPA: M13 family metallopeptidase [Pyrinomonadaceae bacterium]|jgi:putative endopeptidase|nr:M13 family metallopeptidase [Pyrinomonadaceae bacterium]
MSKLNRIAIVLALALSVSIAALSVGRAPSRGFDLSNLDTTCQPCQDFYQYANGGWLAKNPIPSAYPAWGVGSVLSEQNRDKVHEILEESAKNTGAAKGSSDQKVGDFYASCMDEAKINEAGIKPLEPELARINQVKDQRSLQDEIARLHTYGVNVLFGSGSTQDAKNSAEVIVGLGQGGLGLPDRDYYFKDDEKAKTLRDQYAKHVAKMFELLGDDATKAAAEAQTVMGIETKLAGASMTRVDQRDPNKIYNRMTLAKLKTLTPNFAWPDYFRKVGNTQQTDVIVGQPEFFKALDQQLTAVSIPDWRTYMRWQLIHWAAPSLSTPFVEENFNFYSRALTGTQEMLPRWKRCVRSTDNALGEAVGQVYVKRAFPPEAKARALEMVKNLEAALKSDISTLSWMSEPTRKQAIIKLDAFLNKIGYPDTWRDYSRLSVDRDSYLNNRMRAIAFENDRDLRKIGKPVDRTEWGMTPPTVNAYYNPQINEIVFPAGILQPPFFDPTADDALNYGAMGSVIGHEMTHGFDDEGRQFDAKGNLINWWTDADLKAFQERANCVVNQFNSFEVEKGLNENGKLVAGESIADLGGLVIAYAAFQKSMEGKPRPADIDGFTPEQRFFLGYAHGWATNMRPELSRQLTLTDPHPLPKFRVNGPLSNLPMFAQAFHCKQGDAMVRSDKERCQIW